MHRSCLTMQFVQVAAMVLNLVQTFFVMTRQSTLPLQHYSINLGVILSRRMESVKVPTLSS